METKKRLTIGIVGGLCPLATADIYLKAMKQVKAVHGDLDYPDIIISAALEQECRGNQLDDTTARGYNMDHRLLYIYQVARELNARGVDRILVPDFLSYSFASTISSNIKTPLVDIVAVLVEQVKQRWPEVGAVGLLAATSVINQKIFDEKFAARKLRIVYPEQNVQENMVMEAVYGSEGVKWGVTRGRPGELIRQACEHLRLRGAELLVSAITELPLIEREYYPQDNYLDCNEAIGRELVQPHDSFAGKTEKYGIIGILGGLGPAATVDLFDKIIKHTPAGCDQEHIKIVVENNPQIPDRTAALCDKGENPSVAMLATAEKLKAAGVDFIIVPCHTAHVFLPAIQQHISIPILSIIEETINYITKSLPKVKKVGLLATSGTVNSNVYRDALRRKNLDLIVPTMDSQKKLVMRAIYGKEGIKTGHNDVMPRNLLLQATTELVGEGVEVIILGCTEIPLVLHDGDSTVPLIDPTQILAKAAVEHAMKKGAE